MKKTALLWLILLAASASGQQVGKFEWDDFACIYESTYDARRYSEKQIRDTYLMWRAADDYRIEQLETLAFELKDIEKLRRVEAIDAEYRKKMADLRALQVVDVPFWKNYKAQQIVVLERLYLLARASAQAYEKPSALREADFADACVKRFAPPMIAGGDELLKLWREVSEEERAKSGDDETGRLEFERRSASADKFRFAQMEILTFGWWNCVNDQIPRPEKSDAHLAEFRKLFKTTKKTFCNTP